MAAVFIYSVYSNSNTSCNDNSTEIVYPMIDGTYIHSGDYSHSITLHNNLSAVDPTYNQVIEFIKKDMSMSVYQENHCSLVYYLQLVL